MDDPEAVLISTAEVYIVLFYMVKSGLMYHFSLKGEELKEMIGAAAYIECSSKTQQV